MSPPPRPPPALPEELVEEVLIRIPPAEPAILVRAALVCKTWCRLLSRRGFRRRFLEFHRSPPMLGFVCTFDNGYFSRFVPACSFRPPHAVHEGCVLDARHGYVLLSTDADISHLVVWDPTTDERWQLPTSPLARLLRNATVLCAATANGACDHLDCSGRPFIVVLMGANYNGRPSLWVYSSEAGGWSGSTRLPELPLQLRPAVLVGNTLCFLTPPCTKVLTYDLATREKSIVPLPSPFMFCHDTVLMKMEGGGLGVAGLDGAARLSLWSLEANPNGVIRMGRWTRIRVIELDKLLPVHASSICSGFLGPVNDVGVLFVGTSSGLFTFDLKSGRVRKVCEDPCDGVDNSICEVVPYMSFYTPAPLKDLV